ncbi:response regulator [Candidatus Pacearchaeota archaeon]|nr:response regulator [Candidatus Pacearchaeota archaeon]
MEKRKIVVADDHIQTAINIANFLDFSGFKTFQAYNMNNVVELCKRENPDLLVIDIKMSGIINGDCNIEKELPSQKILFLASENEPKKAKCRNSFGVISKPVDNDILLDRIKRILKI